MDRGCIIPLCIFAFYFSFVSCDIFTTMRDLKDLSQLENLQLAKLEEHLKHSEERLNQIKSFVSELKPRTRGALGKNALDVAGHPLDAFGLVKRWHLHGDFANNYFPANRITACSDEHESCKAWADIGECDKNPEYMLKSCRRSCRVCEAKVHSVQREMTTIIANMRNLLPTKEDMDGAADAMLRLQSVYNMTVRQLRMGQVDGHQSSVQLTARDCIDIGLRALEKNDYKLAVEWFSEAKLVAKTVALKHEAIYHTAATLELVQDAANAYATAREAFNGKEPDLSCVDNVMGCQQLADNNLCTLDINVAQKKCPLTCGFCQPPLKTGAHHYELLGVLARTKEKSQEQVQRKTVQDLQNSPARNLGYEHLCQSTVLGNGTLYKDKKLKCKYISHTVPWIRYKLEVLSMSPFISVVYEVIQDTESKNLQELARLRLDRSRVVLSEKGANSTSDKRISKQTYISDQDDPVALRLSRRIEFITGLDTTSKFNVRTQYGTSNIGKSADSFQVVNYGMGGHYSLHHDFVKDPDLNPTLAKTQNVHLFGDRIATFMFYLNDVRLGGNTVFPKVNISIQPIKNAAAFWYNAAPSGEYEDHTFHGGCPVTLGEKWIANKWMREYGNQMKRKCGSRYDSFQEI